MFGILPKEQNMNIKDNFGADKKDQNAKREDYMNNLSAEHGPRKASGLSWAADEEARERSHYVDSFGNGKTYYMSPELIENLTKYLLAGNKIQDANFEIKVANEKELTMTLSKYKTSHKLRPFE